MSIARPERLRDERGSVLLLGVGFVGVIALALAVAVNGAALLLQRQALMAVADAAALAGAQSIDLATYYAIGAGTGTRLDPAAAASAARWHVARMGEQVPGMRIDDVGSDGTSIVVQVSAPMDLPFAIVPIGDERIRVRSAARLDLRP